MSGWMRRSTRASRRCAQELKACLQLSRDVGVVFAASGTDAQLHALFLARSVSGAGLATIVVGADQTGSGTLYTARGRHFANVTARGSVVCKDAPIPGLSCESVALPLFDGAAGVAARADTDDAVLRAIEAAVADGSDVLLHIMDSSKLGWRAPSEACLDEIGRRWPQRVQVVVDACQMRLGRARIRTYLDRGYMVLITGSKFFGGPAFSGALLVPGSILGARVASEGLAGGLQDYASRSDWPEAWALRSRFSGRPNLGQWLRWEAALEEIKAYYRVPAAFRHSALRQLRDGVESLMARSPRFVRSQPADPRATAMTKSSSVRRSFRSRSTGAGPPISADDCQVLYRALARDLGDAAWRQRARPRDRETPLSARATGSDRWRAADRGAAAVLRRAAGHRGMVARCGAAEQQLCNANSIASRMSSRNWNCCSIVWTR